jgi:hypothetical protein
MWWADSFRWIEVKWTAIEGAKEGQIVEYSVEEIRRDYRRVVCDVL